jgi:iron complex transport system substrate-binding protein
MTAPLMRPIPDGGLNPRRVTSPEPHGHKLAPVDGVTRRGLLAGAAALLVVAGCGGNGDQATGPAPAASPTATARTVEHKYGTTEIHGSPERVVTVGLSDHDAVLALGIVPVGVTADPEFSADQPYGVWPWAQDQLGNGQPEVLPFPEIDFERITALRPDLILAVYSGITDQEYEQLSQIAPTVAQSGEYPDYGTPWQEMTQAISRALGHEHRAEELIAEVEGRFAEAREQHPEFEGATAVYAGIIDTGQYYAETAQSNRVGILTSLGFEIPEEITSDEFYMEISQEQLSLLDRDVLLWEIGDRPELTSSIQDNPLYQQLNVVREGRDIFVEDKVLAGALAYNSVLSLPFVIDRLVPKLAAAVDGNPATEVPG